MQQHLIRVMLGQEPMTSQGKPSGDQMKRKKEFDQIKDVMITNSLNIPLQVDMELCDPSWATKVDLDKALSNGHFKTRMEDFIDWE